MTNSIRRLPEALVNRIAAGEVVERPAAAVKELVENAIDAGATQIEIVLRDGGKTQITVTDNGSGMTAAELELAVERHATSKLPDDDLVEINTLGFRGEALPSIGAVARLTLTSRRLHEDSAWSLEVSGGKKGAIAPAALGPGTRVDVRDLFFATPARLKFLKTSRTEANWAADAVERLAMAHPDIAFTLEVDTKRRFHHPAASNDMLDTAGIMKTPLLARLASVMGAGFAANACIIDAERQGIRLTGYAGNLRPTRNVRPSSVKFFAIRLKAPLRRRSRADRCSPRAEAVRGAQRCFRRIPERVDEEPASRLPATSSRSL